MSDERNIYVIPEPAIDVNEVRSSLRLLQRYNNLLTPNKILTKAGKTIVELIPKDVKDSAEQLFRTVNEADIYKKTLSVISDSFKQIERYASGKTLSEEFIISAVNSVVPQNTVTDLKEFCLARGYNISSLVFDFKRKNLFYAMANGAGTGAFGLAGLPANLALTLFLYYRAVQSVAMIYGYNVKTDNVEMVIAGEVLIAALNPLTENSGGINGALNEFLALKPLFLSDKGDASPEALKKLCEIKSMAKESLNQDAYKSTSGGFEYTVYKKVFEKLGEKFSKKILKKGIPLASTVIGAVTDSLEMNTVIEYADIFYNKRFLAEKKDNLKALST